MFKQKGYWFVFLLNLKAIYKNSDATFSYIADSKIYQLNSKREDDSRSLIFKHELQGGLTYIDGIHQRGELMGNIYSLDKISFESEDIVIDCGANLGDLLLWFQNRFINIKYVGFEPSPEEFKCLKKNISQHEVHQVALWNQDGVLSFYLSSQEADSSLIEPPSYNNVIKVNARRLDSYIRSEIKLLKLEAEGGELEVLEGLNNKIHLIEYISADLGPERGKISLSTFVPVKNYLEAQNFSLISTNHQRYTFLFRNNNYQS